MSKRSQVPGNNPHGDQHEKHRDDGKRYISGEVSVRGEVEANLPVSLVEELKRANTDSDARENTRDRREDKRFTVEIWTLIFVIIVGGVNIFLARQAKRTADTADDTLKMGQRAWVNAESFEVKRVTLPPAGRFEVYGIATLRNFGTSIATSGWSQMIAAPNTGTYLNVHWDDACKLVDRQMTASKQSAALGAADVWPIGFVLAPNQETRSMAFDIFDDFTPEQLRNGFYLLGCAKYSDQFGRAHVTRFCFLPTTSVYSDSGAANVTAVQICNGFQYAD